MRFKVDENLPNETAEFLRSAGYDAETVLDEALGGATDTNLSEICQIEERVLLTFDTDFADIRAYPPESHFGLLVFRLFQQDKPYFLARLTRLLPLLGTEPLVGHLWIVEDEQVRIR